MSGTNDEVVAAFTAVYTDAYDDVLRFVQRRLHPDGAGAEDVVAETMTTAWRRVGDLPVDPGDARAWLFGIARNVLLNASRSSRRREALGVRLAAIETAAVSPDAAPLAVSRADLSRAWSRLDRIDQDILALAVFEGLDSARSGRVLGMSPGSYRMRLSRARSTLRRHLDGDVDVASHLVPSQETR